MSNVSLATSASCCFQKVAKIPKYYEFNILDPSLNASPKFVVGGSSDAEILVAYTKNFVWVFKISHPEVDHDLMSSVRADSYLGVKNEDCTDNNLAMFDLIASKEFSQSDCISSLNVLNISKSKLNSNLTAPNQESETMFTWNCIVLGFESGSLQFFTESFNLLTQVSWIQSKVKSIKVCKMVCSQQKKVTLQSSPDTTAVEHFMVLSDDQSFLSLPLSKLCELLLQWRFYRAKVASSGDSFSWDLPNPISLDAITRWPLLDLSYADEVHVMPQVIQPDTFEHLKTASILGGAGAKPKSSAPRFVRFISTGEAPYIGVFDHIIESGESYLGPNLTKLASNYANRLKSSFWSASSSLFYGQPVEEELKMNETELNLRFGFNDAPRLAEHSVYSPFGNLIAIADNLSRVLLFDVSKGVIVRVFKGYRNAKLGWYVATHVDAHASRKKHNRKQKRRQALFLVIHATKRCLLEVWPMMFGSRAAAFKVPKSAVLLNHSDESYQDNPDQILLLDSVTGEVSRLSVPYHFAFSDHTGARQKDVVISNKISEALSNPENLNESLSEFLAQSFDQLHNPTFVLENLNLVASYELLDVHTCDRVLTKVEEFLAATDPQEPMELEEDSPVVKPMSKPQVEALKLQYKSLLLCNRFYENLWGLYDPCANELPMTLDASELLEQLEFLSHSSNQDFKFNLFHIANSLQESSTTDLNTLTAQSPVQNMDSFIKLSDFFSFFELSEDNAAIISKPSLTNVQKANLGAFIFFPVLKGDVKVDALLDLFQCDAFASNRMSLLDILLSYWLSEEKLLDNYQDSVEMLHLHSLVSWMLEDSNDASDCKAKWQFIRKTLQCSSNVTSALTAAIMIRGICITSLTNQETASEKLSSSNKHKEEKRIDVPKEKWFKLSYDIELFNLLIYRLEDCVLFAALSASSSKPNVLSVDSILAQGKGALSEFLAKWLIDQKVSCADYKLLATHKSTISATMIKSLHKKLPISLRDDYVFCQTAWLSATKWSSNPDEHRGLDLMSLDYLKKVPDETIRNGTAQLLWGKIFHRLVLALWDHMNKALEPLFPRSMAKDLDIHSPDHLLSILEYAFELLDGVLLEPKTSEDLTGWDMSASELVKNSYDCEEHWIEASRGNQECIPELSQKQPRSNYSLIAHMRLLVVVLRQFLLHNLFRKFHFRPKMVFDDVQCQAFSQPLHSFPLTSSRNAPHTVLAARHDFFSRCFFVAVADQSEVSIGTTSYDNLDILYDAGGSLGLSSDWLIQTHILALYWHCMDDIACELVAKVADQQSLALRLIEVVAFRVDRIVRRKTEQFGVVNVQSKIPANLKLWVETTRPPPWIAEGATVLCSEKGMQMVCELARLAMKLLPDNHSLYMICQSCLDAMNLLYFL